MSRRGPGAASTGCTASAGENGCIVLTRWVESEKRYRATVDRDLPPGLGEVFAAGTLRLDGEDTPCLPARYEALGPREAFLTLTEGRYHQVRRMFAAAAGATVLTLRRDRFGALELGSLPAGQWRVLSLDTFTEPVGRP